MQLPHVVPALFSSSVVVERRGVRFLTLLQLSYTIPNVLGGVWAVDVVNIDACSLWVTTKWTLMLSKSWAEVSNSGWGVVIHTLQK